MVTSNTSTLPADQGMLLKIEGNDQRKARFRVNKHEGKFLCHHQSLDLLGVRPVVDLRATIQTSRISVSGHRPTSYCGSNRNRVKINSKHNICDVAHSYVVKGKRSSAPAVRLPRVPKPLAATFQHNSPAQASHKATVQQMATSLALDTQRSCSLAL